MCTYTYVCMYVVHIAENTVCVHTHTYVCTIKKHCVLYSILYLHIHSRMYICNAHFCVERGVQGSGDVVQLLSQPLH